MEPRLAEWRSLHPDRAGEEEIWEDARALLIAHGDGAGDVAFRALRESDLHGDRKGVARWLAICEIVAHLYEGYTDRGRLH